MLLVGWPLDDHGFGSTMRCLAAASLFFVCAERKEALQRTSTLALN